MYEISIVIPCRNDARLFGCLESVDEDVEIVISLNGSSEAMRRKVWSYAGRRRGVIVIELATANLAAALEAGSVRASSDAVLYMDSDCRFAPGAIAKFRRSIRDHDVVKGGIVFESNSWLSSIIARSREHHTSELLTAYKPPLVIRKSIGSRIGGYYFDSRLIWREDSNLDWRIRRANIPIHFEPSAVIFHPPLSLREDLRSTFRYGVGLARSRWYQIPLTEVPRSVASTYRSKGFVPALYMCFRNSVYNAGFIWESVRLRIGIRS